MSNHWFYEFEFPEGMVFSTDLFKILEGIFIQNGFSLINSETGLITGIYNSEPFESENYLKAIGLVCGDGGILDFWNEEENISILLDYEINNRTLLSIILNKALFDNKDTRIGLSDSLLSIFTELCNKFEPDFAYSVDDQIYPEISSEEINYQGFPAIKPETLFWLNYFAIKTIRGLGGEEIFNSFPCKIKNISGNGFIIIFSEHPWELNSAFMQNINNKWQIVKMAYNIPDI
jgi:hypothetical protein